MAWTQDQDALDRYIDRLRVVTGQTAILDAMESIAKELTAQVNSDKVTFDRKVLVLITDGDDRTHYPIGHTISRESDDDAKRRIRGRLIKTMKANGIKVLAVGLTRELESDDLSGMTQKDKAETLLRKITKETGGRVVFPRTKVIEIDELLNELFEP